MPDQRKKNMSDSPKINVIINDTASGSLQAQHGLSLVLEWQDKKWLFDTGAGNMLIANLTKTGFQPAEMAGLILSHGHYDHTGGLAEFLNSIRKEHPHLLSPGTTVPTEDRPSFTLWHAPGIGKKRYVCHENEPVREISMPNRCQETFRHIASPYRQIISGFTQIDKHLFLTGPIPRISSEDCGGPFYLDPDKQQPDDISDEQSLVIRTEAGNILITGCCHAGIINTMEHCKNSGFPIHVVLGGLHLNRASEHRLDRTVGYLNRSEARQLYLLHCTGENAMEYLTQKFNGNTRILSAGEQVVPGSLSNR